MITDIDSRCLDVNFNIISTFELAYYRQFKVIFHEKQMKINLTILGLSVCYDLGLDYA